MASHEKPVLAAPSGPSFTPELINADTKISPLTARLSDKVSGRAVSLCLSGTPGAGESAYARHLSKSMDMPVIQKRASDILSKWVGGSEYNIAAAFAEACDTNAFLIFDEVGSLLSSREAIPPRVLTTLREVLLAGIWIKIDHRACASNRLSRDVDPVR